MPAVNGVGEPCAGEPHARIEVAAGGIWRRVWHAKRRRRLPPTLHEVLVTRVEASQRVGCEALAATSDGVGWLGVVVGAVGGRQVAIADTAGMPARPGPPDRGTARQRGAVSSAAAGPAGG
jgi:hypothetical protein